jgi:hypothetical protein
MLMTETERINVALDLQDLELPSRPRVTRLEWAPYEDSLGDEAVEVWVLLDADTRDEEIEGRWVSDVITKILHSLQRREVGLFPYVRFAREGERESLDEQD